MRDLLNTYAKLNGYVRLQNEAGDIVTARNLVVYTGGDIIANLLAGDMDYQIAAMYFAYENTAGTPTGLTPARSDTAAIFHALSAPQDFIRASVYPSPLITASDGNHTGNQASFVAIASATTGVHGVAFGSASNSKVFSLGIVAAPTGVYTGDVLYAHFALPTALAAVGSGQISATWMLEAD